MSPKNDYINEMSTWDTADGMRHEKPPNVYVFKDRIDCAFEMLMDLSEN